MFWNRNKNKETRLDNPRPHHYIFAHQILRQVCQNNLMEFFSVIASADQRNYLGWLWEFAEKQVGEKADGINSDQIKVTTGKVSQNPLIILEMPKPLAVPEAYFVGVVLTGFDGSSNEQNIGFRYFTLEYGLNIDESERTVMCEWSGDTHLNLGDGPKPELSQFIKAIEEKI